MIKLNGFVDTYNFVMNKLGFIRVMIDEGIMYATALKMPSNTPNIRI